MNPRLQSFMMEAINVCTTLDELSNEMKAIKASSEKKEQIGENVLTDEEMTLYREARQYYFENKLKPYWTNVSRYKNDDGRVTYQTFVDWLESKDWHIPSYMSRNAFFDMFHDELQALYDKELKFTIKEDDDAADE